MLKVFCYIDAHESDYNRASSTSNKTNESFFVSFEEGFSPDTRTCYLVKAEGLLTMLSWLGGAAIINFFLGLVSWWKCYANNYLQWGALATWLILLLQGKTNGAFINYVTHLGSEDLINY